MDEVGKRSPGSTPYRLASGIVTSVARLKIGAVVLVQSTGSGVAAVCAIFVAVAMIRPDIADPGIYRFSK